MKRLNTASASQGAGRKQKQFSSAVLQHGTFKRGFGPFLFADQGRFLLAWLLRDG
jgi:hypothetical protein